MAEITQCLKTLYLQQDSLTKLHQVALESGLNKSLRPLAWRIFLGVLPSEFGEGWEKIIQKQREKYISLRAKHWDNKEMLDPKPKFIDPLAPPTENPVVKENKDILRRVEGDVQRLFSDQEYFTNTELRNKITRMCYVFAKDNPLKNYQQGFHELMAILYHTFDTDNTTTVFIKSCEELDLTDDEKRILRCVLDKEHLEEDIYTIFEFLMKDLGDFYQSKDAKIDDKRSRIQEKCDEIFGYLNTYDGQYHSLLVKHEVINIFAIKWIKMMFAREFLLNDVVIIWDSLFAFGKKLKLLDGFFLAMLHFVRNDIIENNDQVYTMKRVNKFPPVENLHNLITLAINISEGKPPVIVKKVEPQHEKITSKLTGFFIGKKTKEENKGHEKQFVDKTSTPSTMEAIESNETPSWMSESPWGETVTGKKIRAVNENAEKAKAAENHKILKQSIDQLEAENKKEPLDIEAIKRIVEDLKLSLN
ncbi:hypothetical protein EIN_229360 [Entamoeba invadens IP1]|uniref:Rab-GAP TBC domain-containing protein n=1 Tax=Entamoeba invadens IP1 TaxID=370355 RepID=A0A0A1U8V3_ENTIV|nr:hypothetical protein EIN_229360 [Entamoeba invadens IP1]ELP88413.1 hypothetical protein EIN_229360 [Entamoeba invadens IP1]|eukprot:XP_004255184.1 hypothetical protein EIN_229360 [Entamoeba invadens IP1]